MGVELLIELATQGISAILTAFHKKGAAAAVDAANQVAVTILQQTATINGLTIDWSDPAAVLAYIQTLPTFVPIPDPVVGSIPTAATRLAVLPRTQDKPPTRDAHSAAAPAAAPPAKY
jgi:threonine/homoserine/homoserine lactone efflux protein